MTYHFIGLGGIGMSALARILLQKGHAVKGSDAKHSPLLQKLIEEGAEVHIGHSAKAMEGAEVVVYSSSVAKENVELLFAKENNLPTLHRSEMLAKLMEDKKALLVSGTHGKTTTSALLSFTLLQAGVDPSFVVGGLIGSLDTNAKNGLGDYFVAEADESDGSFLRPPAYGAILTNLDHEHLDYWGSREALDAGFEQFIDQTTHLFWCSDDERLKGLKTKGISYGFSEQADLRLRCFRQTKKGILFDLNEYKDIELNLLGKHNALNGAAVFGLCLKLNIPQEIIRKSFELFPGVARRMELKGEKHKLRVYDDYAHHPNEIRATLKALRDHIGERRLIAIFQPHRFSRVRDLFEEFSSAFEEADLVILTDIYSAGESSIPHISNATLFAKFEEKLGTRVHFYSRNHLESEVTALLQPLDVVVTLGAGDVTHIGSSVLKLFADKSPKYNLAILYGGMSAEHPVSIMSVKNFIKVLDPSVYNTTLFGITQEGQWIENLHQIDRSYIAEEGDLFSKLMKCDVALPVFHGPKGEDGMIAGFLEALRIPYVGCDYRSGAICMHKAWTKQIVAHHQVAVAPYFEMHKRSFSAEVFFKKMEENFFYPVWIKPVHLGSSIGVRQAKGPQEALKAIEDAFGFDEEILVEKHVEGRQIEFSVLGNERLQIAPPGEIMNRGTFVGYDKKYGEGAMKIVEAKLSENEKQIGYELAERVYRACGCKGLARVDFFLTPEGIYWFNEINPFPGFTDTSAYPLMWEAGGMAMEELVDEMIALSLQRSFK